MPVSSETMAVLDAQRQARCCISGLPPYKQATGFSPTGSSLSSGSGGGNVKVLEEKQNKKAKQKKAKQSKAKGVLLICQPIVLESTLFEVCNF